MSISQSDLAAACRKWGVFLKDSLPAAISGAQLLWALSGNESSFGNNCTPRHENIYCDKAGGKYSTHPDVQRLTRLFGCDAHKSYGPWQIMLVNCSSNTTPEDMQRVDRCALETAAFIRQRILLHEHATTLEQIADAYNSGDWRDKIKPEKYIADLVNYYRNCPLPDLGK